MTTVGIILAVWLALAIASFFRLVAGEMPDAPPGDDTAPARDDPEVY